MRLVQFQESFKGVLRFPTISPPPSSSLLPCSKTTAPHLTSGPVASCFVELAAFEALLKQRQPDDVPALRNGRTIQQVVPREFRMLQELCYEVAVLTPMDWIDIYRGRHTLRQQLQRCPLSFRNKRQHSQTPSPPLPFSLQQPTSCALFHAFRLPLFSFTCCTARACGHRYQKYLHLTHRVCCVVQKQGT